MDDICFVVCDGLKGLPDSVGSAYPAAIVQTCIIHLIRNTLTCPVSTRSVVRANPDKA